MSNSNIFSQSYHLQKYIRTLYYCIFKEIIRQFNAEEAEAHLTAEEKEVLVLAAKAEDKMVPVKATVPTKVSKDVKAKKTEQVEKETKTSAAEVTDEICSDSEYGSKSPDEDSKEMPKSVEVSNHPKPPPIRDRTLGGKDYYTLTYYDYPSDDDYIC